MSESANSTADESKPSANSNVVTESDFIAARIGQLEAKKNPPKAETTKATDEAGKQDGAEAKEEVVAQNEAAKTESETENTDVLSQIDLDKLSESELTKLAEKLRSKAISRYGELSHDKRAANQKIAELEAELAKHRKPLEAAAPTIPKEYAEIEKIEVLQDKLTEAKATMEWAEVQLDNAEGMGLNDEIQTEYGQFTKAKLKELYRAARRAKDEWIPAQHIELQHKAERAALRESYAQKAKEELKWLDGEDNEVRKQYEALIKSPLVEKIRKAVPEAESDLEYVLGHAINSISGRTYHALTAAETPKKSPSITPPSPAKSATAGKGDELLSKRVRELEQKVQTTGSEADFLALRTAKRSKRA